MMNPSQSLAMNVPTAGAAGAESSKASPGPVGADSGPGAAPAAESPDDKGGEARFADYVAEAMAAEPVDEENAEEVSGEKSELEEILEKGFSAWVSEMRKEKLEEKIRQRVLAGLGISERGLASMSAEQRAQIEQAIQDEIKRIMVEKAKEASAKQGKDGRSSFPVLPGAFG